jgi:hypothetical protein
MRTRYVHARTDAEPHTYIVLEERDAPKVWVLMLPARQPEKVPLARIVDADGGRDEAENSYYEWASDPNFVRLEKAQRQFRGQYLRRLRRLRERDRHGDS